MPDQLVLLYLYIAFIENDNNIDIHINYETKNPMDNLKGELGGLREGQEVGLLLCFPPAPSHVSHIPACHIVPGDH